MNTKRTPSLDDLPPDQRAAVVAFRDKYGDGWQRKLLDAWLCGQDVAEPNGSDLRRVRNNFGPKWLSKIKD